jgi:hypothetical protein
MGKDLLYLVDLNTIQLDEHDSTSSSWVHGLPLGEYTHPVFGKLNITMDKIKRFADNIKSKVRGIDPSINYNHNNEDVAAGWVKDAEARDTGLWIFVEWTKNAVDRLKNKEYRYLSAEYHDTWEAPTGQKFQDVLFGAALTNRPFMKNLVPINLSENSVNYAFELVNAITKAREVQDMDLKKLNELLGLPADSTQEVAFAKLAESLKAPESDKDQQGPPKVPAVNVSIELKKLAEENPMVAALIQTVDDQNKVLTEFQVELRESAISKKLSEFDHSKIILTPVAKDKIHDFLLDAPVELHEKFWDILGLMKTSSGLLVELGERAGAGVRYGRSKDSVALFMDEANRVAQERSVSLDEAMTVVSREQPELWNGYRQGSYSFKE